MNDMVPDAANFLADMPLLEDVSSGEAVVVQPAEEARMPEQVAENMIPDSTAFLMDGFAAEADELLPATGTEHTGELPQVAASEASAPPPAEEARVPEQTAENMIPDSTAFLMDGFAAEADELLPAAGAEHTGESPQVAASEASAPPPDFSDQLGLLPPSVALGSSQMDLREGLAGGWGTDRRQTLSAKLGFHVGDLRFVVSFDAASELSEMVAVYRLPNVPSWFRGLANLHGNLVPVFDVAAMIGSQVQPGKDRMLLVLGHGSMAAGMLVNELPTRIRLETATAIDLPELPHALKDCVPKAYLHEQEIWLELQYQRFFEMTAARLAS